MTNSQRHISQVGFILFPDQSGAIKSRFRESLMDATSYHCICIICISNKLHSLCLLLVTQQDLIRKSLSTSTNQLGFCSPFISKNHLHQQSTFDPQRFNSTSSKALNQSD